MNQKKQSGCGGPIIEGDVSLKNLIKKIGKGPKLSRDLSFEEARAAMVQILTGQALPEQIGAFLIAQRMKSETIDETAGMLQALRDQSKIIQPQCSKLLELASAHDGKNKSYVLSPFVAKILTHAGLSVLLTGGVDVPTKKGIAAYHICKELGWKVDNTAEQVKDKLENNLIAYWDVKNICLGLESLKSLRDVLGLRTVLNTIEKVINPANANYICTGIFHGPYLKVLSSALLQLNYPNVLCIQATEASTDLPLKKRVLYRRVLNHQLSEQLEVSPEPYGLKRDSNPEFQQVSVKENIDAVFAAIEKKQGLVYDALIYNVAVQLWFCEECESVDVGIDQAKKIFTDLTPNDFI